MCAGEGADCQAFQNVTSCNEADGVVDVGGGCPGGQFNFVYNPDICNGGQVVDECEGTQVGSWCG